MTKNQSALRSSASFLIGFSWLSIIASVLLVIFSFLNVPNIPEAHVDKGNIIMGILGVFFGVLMLSIGRFFDVIVDIADDINKRVDKDIK